MVDAIDPADYYDPSHSSDIVWKSSNYYKRDTNGNMRVWCIWVASVPGRQDRKTNVGSGRADPDVFYYQAAHGVTTGTISLDQATKIDVARSQDTIKEQAIFDAKSKVKNKIKGGYLDNEAEAKDFVMVRPMKAQTFKDRGHNITYPAVAQRKYDGVRVLIRKMPNGEVTLTSRGGENYKGFRQIENAVKRLKLPDGFVLDGELYQHGTALQSIGGIARKGMNESWDKMSQKEKEAAWEKKDPLYVRIYDGINTKDMEEGWFHRYNKAMKIIGDNPKLKKVESYIVADADAAYDLQKQFLDEGYEGAMIRNLHSPYKFSRSVDLLKMKNFDDAEFKIVGAHDAGGNHAGAIMWVCETTDENGNEVTFNVTPLGTIEDRRKLFQEYEKDPSQFIGKEMTVRYMGLNPKTNIPNIAKGVAIRDYE
jgi:ATP-dependent DNA ligase